MNLHVTNDDYGFFPSGIAKRIRSSGKESVNRIVNLSKTSHFRDDMISYISISHSAFKNYINSLAQIDKIIFHPYNVNSLRFLKQVHKKFPHVKVYWVCWSYELYHQSHISKSLYEPFSAKYLKGVSLKKFLGKLWVNLKSGSLYNYSKRLVASYDQIDYFCSMLPSDFDFFISISPRKNIEYIPFAYLSLNNIIPDMDNFHATGNRIMIGHSASPQGNHYEILEKLASIDKDFSILLPLAYGDKKYAAIIKREAKTRFKDVFVQEEKLETNAYYHLLMQSGWTIMNVKIQQGLGNILALLWMGTKLFLDNNTSTYKDLIKWGIMVYSLQDITKEQLTQKLTNAEAENNRRVILERFDEVQVQKYWEPLLN